MTPSSPTCLLFPPSASALHAPDQLSLPSLKPGAFLRPSACKFYTFPRKFDERNTNVMAPKFNRAPSFPFISLFHLSPESFHRTCLRCLPKRPTPFSRLRCSRNALKVCLLSLKDDGFRRPPHLDTHPLSPLFSLLLLSCYRASSR